MHMNRHFSSFGSQRIIGFLSVSMSLPPCTLPCIYPTLKGVVQKLRGCFEVGRLSKNAYFCSQLINVHVEIGCQKGQTYVHIVVEWPRAAVLVHCNYHWQFISGFLPHSPNSKRGRIAVESGNRRSIDFWKNRGNANYILCSMPIWKKS